MKFSVVALMACLCAVAVAEPVRKLDPRIGGWLPANRRAIDALLTAKRPSSPRPVATFDWDNTMMKNDIGDVTMAWMLRHNALVQPPGRDWSRTSGALTDAALRALGAACDQAGAPGQTLETAGHPRCADEIFSIYDDGKTAAGANAWTRQITLTTNEAYAWEARLLGGRSIADAHRYAQAAYREAAKAPLGATQTVGTRAGVGAWCAIYEPMRDLVGALKAAGFDVWIVSASPQAFAEVVASEVGIDAAHVIGVRTVVDKNRYGYELESCGGAPPNTLITFNQGKRCWINKAIFHAPVDGQRARGERRQAFAAGDSDTDLAFVQDATELKLAIDRHKIELMCNAYANAGGRWLVQPMFIQPMAAQKAPYPCASAVDAAGAVIRDEDGRPIADQRAR